MTDDVFQAAWDRGYLLPLRGGGTTAVAQVNDTRGHRRLSDAYQALEMEDAMNRHLAGNRGVVNRSRLECERDLAAT
eukprot:5946249-Alexandrium_andersonii.AAC.1